MGREVRMVPKDWEHPKNEYGKYQPMFDSSYKEAAEEYLNNVILWGQNKHPDQSEDYCVKYEYYWEWGGNPPDQ